MTVPVDISSATNRYFGQSIKRREDPKYLTGQSQYTDDLAPSGTLYAAIVRSPYAHARIARINVEEVRRWPGVVAVYTGADPARPHGGLALHVDLARDEGASPSRPGMRHGTLRG